MADKPFPAYHVLDYLFDSNDSSALTVLVRDVRFHIIADPRRLKGESGKPTKKAREYTKLLSAIKRNREEELDIGEYEEHSGLHATATFGVKLDSDGQSRDSALGSDAAADENLDRESDGEDSGVSMDEWKQSSDLESCKESPEALLQDWILSSCGELLHRAESTDTRLSCKSVWEWYTGQTRYFFLEIKHGKLQPVKERGSPSLQKRMQKLIPKLSIPKYIRDLDIPWISAKDLDVLHESEEQRPYHPAVVRWKDKEYFFKIVDNTQPAPTKRELCILSDLERKGLQEEIRVPRLIALVGFENSKTDIMGFLQTSIKNPKPLTNMLHQDVPQRKREKWAEEAKRTKRILHENGIVWGDAKADNFMVDEEDNLWIIDFGGSYTDGWVDPELVETFEGDDMGMGRIVNALTDPVNNTFDPTETHSESNREKTPRDTTKKRKASHILDQADEKQRGSVPTTAKRRRSDRVNSSSTSDNGIDPASDSDGDDAGQTEITYCICNRESDGDMIACDGNDCPFEWFHFTCVGLDSAPESKEWYCKDCKPPPLNP